MTDSLIPPLQQVTNEVFLLRCLERLDKIVVERAEVETAVHAYLRRKRKAQLPNVSKSHQGREESRTYKGGNVSDGFDVNFFKPANFRDILASTLSVAIALSIGKEDVTEGLLRKRS